MNRMKFYRRKKDGTIEVATVKVCQPRGKALWTTKSVIENLLGESFMGTTKQVSVLTYPTVWQAKTAMTKDGWAQNKREVT